MIALADRSAIFALAAAVFVGACSSESGSGSGIYPTTSEFAANAKVGKLYSCLSPDRSRAVAAWIGAITDQPEGRVYHVQVLSIRPDGLPLLGHAPFVATSFAHCLPDEELGPLLPVTFNAGALESGLATWRRNSGGVFAIPIENVFQMIQQVVTPSEQVRKGA